MFRTTAVLALAASGLIALSSCSSGGPASTSAEASTTRAQPASSAASTGTGTGLIPAVSEATPSVRVGQLTEVFATPLPSDPAKAKVIEEWRESQVVWDQSIQVWRVLASASAYITGNAFVRLHTAVATDASYHVILTGPQRFYHTNVTSLTADGATVTSCDDASKALDENPSTGHKYPNGPGSPVIFFVTWQLVPVAGRWAITSYTLVAAPDPRERVCAGG